MASFALLVVTNVAGAQQWASKMFSKLDHDFGVVARGSEAVYRFEVKNIFKEDIYLESVRSSCGCTSPSIENNLIKTYEKAYIVAKFNTRTFTGVHSATLTVTITKPYPAQVQLRVHGNIRGDVVFEPGMIDFGDIDQGATPEKTVSVTYAGRSDWKIDDVRSASDNLEVELIERQRQLGKVTYDLLTRVRPTATAGYLQEQLVIVTNDLNNPRIAVDVAARIKPEIAVAPENLVLGEVDYDATISKKLLVRGKQPFKLTEVVCADPAFTFEYDDSVEKPRHIVTVTLTAQKPPGPFKSPIVFKTSLGDSYTTTCYAYATVKAAPAEDAGSEEQAVKAGETSETSTTVEKTAQAQ